MTQLTPTLKAQIEELLGLRPGAAGKRAVRFSDLKNGLALGGGGFNAEAVKNIAEKVAREVAEGYDGAAVDLGQLRQDIEQAQADAEAARNEVINAVSAANAARDYADALVSAVRADLAVDFATAQEAATTAAQQIQDAADAVIAEADRVQVWSAEAQQGATQAQAARDLAVIAREDAQGHRAAAELAAGISATARDQSGAAANAAATSRDQAAGFASDSEASAVASQQDRLAAQAARGGAETARAGAEAARDTSVSAKNDAEGARSQAQTSANLAATSRNEAAGFADAAGTARTQAQNSASAAAGSASTAATQASNAGSSAVAANNARIGAEAARDGANAASASAGINRDQAVIARQNAETAAAGAQESLNLTAEVSGRDMSVINDTFLMSSDWARVILGGQSFSILPSSVYPIGRDWRFGITIASSQDGMRIANSPATIWTGQVNAIAYAIEVEFTLNSGVLSGAGIQLTWNNDAGQQFPRGWPLSNLVLGPPQVGRTQTASGIFVRPEGFTGSFSSHSLSIYANAGGYGTLSAKNITFHRVRIRPATAEERGLGQVTEGVRANLLVDYLTSAQTNQAIATLEESMTASMGGSLAAVRRSASAIANLSGSVARLTNVVSVNGEQAAAGIEAVAFNQNGGTTGSLLKLIGDNVVVPGTLSADRLVVGLGKNLLQDPDFMDGTAHWRRAFFLNSAVLAVRTPGPTNDFRHSSLNMLHLVQSSAGADGYQEAAYAPLVREGANPGRIPVRAGSVYIASAYLSAHRCNAMIVVYFYNYLGQLVGTNTTGYVSVGAGSPTLPDTWARLHAKVTAPAGAETATITIRKTGTTSGNDSALIIWKPQFEESHAQATGPSPWGGSGTGMWDGNRLITDSVTARVVSSTTVRALMGRFGSLAAANITVGNAEIGNAQIANAAISNAKIGNAQVDTLKLAGNSVTVQWSANAYTLNIDLSHSANVIIFTQASIRGNRNQFWERVGYTLTVNGTQRDSSHYSAAPSDLGHSRFGSMISLSLSAGTHSIQHSYAGGDVNTPRVVAFARYR